MWLWSAKIQLRSVSTGPPLKRGTLIGISVCIRKIELKITNGMSSTDRISDAKIQLPEESEVRDLKIADDTMIVVLLVWKGS